MQRARLEDVPCLLKAFVFSTSVFSLIIAHVHNMNVMKNFSDQYNARVYPTSFWWTTSPCIFSLFIVASLYFYQDFCKLILLVFLSFYIVNIPEIRRTTVYFACQYLSCFRSTCFQHHFLLIKHWDGTSTLEFYFSLP